MAQADAVSDRSAALSAAFAALSLVVSRTRWFNRALEQSGSGNDGGSELVAEAHQRQTVPVFQIIVRTVVTLVSGVVAVLIVGWMTARPGQGLSSGALFGAFAIGSLMGASAVEAVLGSRLGNPTPPPELFEATLAQLNEPQADKGKKFWPLLLASLAIFIATGGTGPGALTRLILLSAVLGFHEAGHLLAMRLFGYRDTRILFIPFFGAVTTGEREGVSGGQQAIVLLAGPLPGLMLGAALAMSGVAHEPLVRQSVNLLFLINAFNLLPLGALDGGKLFEVLVFSRRPWHTLAFALAGSALLALLALALHAWLLLVLALFMIASTPVTYGVAKVADGLNARGAVPRSLREANPAFLHELFAESYTRVVPAASKLPKRAAALPALCVRIMRQVHGRAVQRPASLLVSLLVVVAYAALVALAITAWSSHRRPLGTPRDPASSQPQPSAIRHTIEAQ